MENCCANLCGLFKKQKPQIPLPNKWCNKLVVLKEPTGREIGLRYELGRELGRDEFGITYLCIDRQTGEELACKSISKNKLRTAIDIEDVRIEVEIMSDLPNHPNIVSLKYTYEDDDYVHLVMEHCEGGGDLLDRIVSRGGYNERSAASIIKTIVQVIKICHKHGVMHRNVRLENFLFADKKETTPLKVTGFRSSIFFQPGERLNQIVGNLYYMAPEVLQRNYGPEIDIWSAGVILYFLLCGYPPFWAEAEQEFAKAITQSVIDFERNPWPMVSDNAKDLVKKMLDPDPKLRLTAQEVLDHPWLINLVKKKPDEAKDLVHKMLTAHGRLDHPWLQNPKMAPNVSLRDTVRGKLLQFSIMRQFTRTTSEVIADHLCQEDFWVRDEEFWVRNLGNIAYTNHLWVRDTAYSNHLWVRDTGNIAYTNHDEVRRRLYRLGQQNPNIDVQRLVDAFDRAKEGYLNYEEFLAFSDHLRKRSHEEHVDNAFQFFDKKQSGYIELEELRKALANEIGLDTEKVIKDIMHDVKTNQDGRISYEEITNRSFELMKEWSSDLKGKCDKDVSELNRRCTSLFSVYRAVMSA